MALSRWKSMFLISLLCGLMLALAACSSASTSANSNPSAPTPTPTPAQGQRLLEAAGQKLNAARTLHGIFNVTTTTQAFSGTIKTEIWNAQPNKSRSNVLQSSLAQLPAGSVIVTDGKQVWEYNPVKKVVYTGAAGSSSADAGAIGQNQLVLTLVQTIFTHSKATLGSSSASIAGHAAYQIHVTPSGQGINLGSTSLNYAGDVYLDKTTDLPLRIDLNITGLGQIRLDISNLALNQSLPDSTFTFTPPPGTKVLPLQQAGSGTNASSITLAQAQQQAGYHLLSIPTSQSAYQLQGVDALGSPGDQVYTLNYTRGSTSFTIIEGKPLANLTTASGQQIPLRGTTAALTTATGASTLGWTEKGVGIQIQGPFSENDIVNIAKMLV